MFRSDLKIFSAMLFPSVDRRTVSPLERVVLSVFMEWLTGEAKPREIGLLDLKAVRFRKA